MRTLLAGETLARSTVTLGHRGTLRGESAAASVLKAGPELTGAIVESEHYATLPEGAKWRSDGIPQLVALRDLIIDGGQSLHDDWTKMAQDQRPVVADGVRLFAGAPLIDQVKIAHCRGAGLVLRRGNNHRQGNWQLSDWEETEIGSLGIAKCYEGLRIETGSDGTIERLIVRDVRGTALEFGDQTGGWHVDFAHLYGCDTGVDSRGGGHYFDHLITETCNVGWTSAAQPTTVQNWQSFATRKIAGRWRRATLCERASLHTLGDGLEITAEAAGSTFDGHIIVEGEGTALTVAGDGCRIESGVWKGGKALVIPRPVTGCRITLTLVQRPDERPYVVEIPEGLGPGNQITLRVRGKLDLRIPPGDWTRRQIEIVRQ